MSGTMPKVCSAGNSLSDPLTWRSRGSGAEGSGFRGAMCRHANSVLRLRPSRPAKSWPLMSLSGDSKLTACTPKRASCTAGTHFPSRNVIYRPCHATVRDLCTPVSSCQVWHAVPAVASMNQGAQFAGNVETRGAVGNVGYMETRGVGTWILLRECCRILYSHSGSNGVRVT